MRYKEQQSGFSLIELLIVVAIIGILAAIAIPNLMASRRAANEASAISCVRTLTTAEAAFRHTTGNGLTYADMSEMLSREMIDPVLANATTAANAKNGYIFGVTTPADKTSFVIGSAAISTGMGSRRFSSDALSVIYADPNDVTTLPTTLSGSALL